MNQRDWTPEIIENYDCLVGAELLASFALQLLPIVCFPDRTFSILLDGEIPGPRFRRVPRGHESYYGAIVPA